jgi:hypothetical protein
MGGPLDVFPDILIVGELGECCPNFPPAGAAPVGDPGVLVAAN